MYYYKKNNNTSGGECYYGAGIVDSLMGVITSQVVKEAAKEVASKTIKEIGNRGAEKIVNKIMPREPKPFVFKGKGLTEKNEKILTSLVTPIQDYVKN